MNTETIRDAVAGSIDGRYVFPDVLRLLSAEGVESYRADLLRREYTFYLASGATHREAPAVPVHNIAGAFDAPAVTAALLAVQTNVISYLEFLSRLAAAGVTHYEVFLDGRKAIYYGRAGDLHIERFPGTAPEHRVAGLKTILVREGHEQEFESMYGELRAAVAGSEPGCLLYSLLKSATNPRTYFVQEQYRDRAALDAHQTSPHGRIWFPKIRAILESIAVEYCDIVIA